MAASKKVLVVDDDPDILEQVALTLEAGGFEVVRSGGRKEAEELLLSVKPDLAVVDLMMEQADSGMVLCHHIKQLYPGTPIIILTAVQSATGLSFRPQSAQAKTWIKADAILDKPFRPEHLRNEVRRLVGATA